LNPTRTTPPCYNNTTLGNRLYAQRKGPNVTNSICWTCKNCSYKCAASCEHCAGHRTVLIIFPLNIQTITITRMSSSGGEGDTTVSVRVVFRQNADISMLNFENFPRQCPRTPLWVWTTPFQTSCYETTCFAYGTVTFDF